MPRPASACARRAAPPQLPRLARRRRVPPARGPRCSASSLPPPPALATFACDALRRDAGALAAARAQYAAEGWLHVRAAVSLPEVAELHAATDALEASAAHLTASGRVRGVFFEVQSASGRKREPAVRPGCMRKLTGPSKGSAPFASLRVHPALLFLAHSVAGVARPHCAVDQVNTKHARVGTGFPWHQDASFLVGAARGQLAAHGGANAVIALDASHAGCGGFEVLGRTHAAGTYVDLRGRYDTSDDNGAGAPGHFDTRRRECPPMAPGDALLFSPYLAHGSGPNPSDARRRIATLWFVGQGDHENC